MLKYLKKYRFYALLAPVFMVGEVMMDLIQPRMMSNIVDNGVLGLNNGNIGDMHIVLTSGIQMIGLFSKNHVAFSGTDRQVFYRLADYQSDE